MSRVLQDSIADILREVGVVGSGGAAKYLEKFLKKEVTVSVPEALMLPVERIAEHIGNPIEIVIGIYSRVGGDVNGYIVYLISLEDARNLLRIVLDKEDKGKGFNTHNLSALAETGNILFGGYLYAVSRFCEMELIPGPPSCTADMLGAIVNAVLLKVHQDQPEAIILGTEFSGGGTLAGGHVLFVADSESMEKIVRSLETRAV